MRMPPALRGYTGVQKSYLHSGGSQDKEKPQIGETGVKSPNDKCEGFAIFNILEKSISLPLWSSLSSLKLSITGALGSKCNKSQHPVVLEEVEEMMDRNEMIQTQEESN
ncbi:hypothetical protein Tco_0440037 [Tanacetum coccineum]